MTTALGQKIAALIAETGPISVNTYFNLCLADPEHGYYKTRDPFGEIGDFTTAPEISQLFGELVGIFLVHSWQQHGAPENAVLIEGGPGRGTMMADILNVIARLAPPLYAGLEVCLIETSPFLRQVQAQTLSRHSDRIRWVDRLDAARPGFTLFVANELFDAIGIRQFVRTENGFFERVVILDDNDNLGFGIGPVRPDPAWIPPDATEAKDGAIFECSPAREAFMAEICDHIRLNGGTALIIDYGHLESGMGDTLQAIRHHQFDPPLAHPGEADLTSHVDFAALAAVAKSCGLHIHPGLHQGAFLAGLGLGPRASALGRGKDPQTQQEIVMAANRLAGSGDGEMGDLFKVLAVSGGPVRLIPFNQMD